MFSIATRTTTPDRCPGGTELIQYCRARIDESAVTCKFEFCNIVFPDGQDYPAVTDNSDQTCSYVPYPIYLADFYTWTFETSANGECAIIAGSGCDLSQTTICFGTCK